MSLVTVICLCYNHARFVEEAVESVISQSYKNIELIVVNDGSVDDSTSKIIGLYKKYPSIIFIDNKENIGMCSSFNKALYMAKGDYIIDLAADDTILPERIEHQVKAFEKLDLSYGIVFSDAYVINERGEKQGTFYRRGAKMELLDEVISGDIFSRVVKKYQIHAPTIMVRKSVYLDLGGYDANLSYEDYDFFIRSSRKYKYHFMDEILTYKREVKGSNSRSFYKSKTNPHLASTLIVLKKYIWLCKDDEEKNAALSSIRYHMRQSLYLECYDLVKKYYRLLQDLKKNNLGDKVLLYLSYFGLPLNKVYSLYRFIAHK
jgi:glycosyltransferase involved in cell wall biosynthesis